MMRRSMLSRRTAAGLVLALAGGVVASAAADDITTCEISAWSSDTDSNGLNVRAGPGTSAAIIAKLPLVDGYFAPEISITGSKDGWFRIDKAVLDDYTATEPKVTFSGEGWVSGRRLGLLLNDMDLHDEPDAESKVLARLSHEDAEGHPNGPDSFSVTRLIGCTSNWVEVEGSFLGTPLRGWATRTCANQVTTCP